MNPPIVTATASASDDARPDSDVFIVDAKQSMEWLDVREVWRYRELIWIFALRDIKVRYRQTFVGIAWTVLQPLAQMLAFGILKKVLIADSKQVQALDDVATFCGLLLYQLFAGILAVATLCLVDNRQMVTKVYFPRIVLPLSCCLRPLLDFGIGLTVLALLMMWFRVPVGFGVLLFPVIVFLTVVVGLAFGLWLSALNAHYRDFSHIVPFFLQLGLFISPAGYGSSQITGSWRWLYFMNPMAALLDAFRWTFVGTTFPGWGEISMSLVMTLFLLFTGAWYFRRVDRFLADSI